MNLILNELERRVMGVLIEKQLTTGDYPMTLNSLTTACNQKSNRDPMMDLDEDAVWNTIEALRERGLASRVLPGGSSRVERYKHEIDTKLQWPKPQKAVLCELLLRGPQTLNELRTRASRMYAFENLDAVTAVLDALAQQSPPLVATLPRQAGQSAVRFTHLLYPPGEKPPTAPRPESAGDTGYSPPPATYPAPGAPAPSAAAPARSIASADVAVLQEQLEAMQSELAELHEEVAGLRRRLDSLEGR